MEIELKNNLYKFAVMVKSEGYVYHLEGHDATLDRMKSDLLEQYGEGNFEILSFEPLTDEEVEEIAPALLNSLDGIAEDEFDDEDQPDFFEQAKPSKYLN